MKKFAVIGSTLAAVLVAGAMVIPAFAASNPADNASNYSYSTGKQSYKTRMAEEHAWYDNEDATVIAGYSCFIGSQAAQARNNAFAKLPSEDDLSEEEMAAVFQGLGLGGETAYADGQYDESAKTGYGYAKGQAANQLRHASFAGSK